MSEARTKTNSVNRLKISDETRRAYERRDKSLDHADPDAPVMPPEFWQGASIGKYYRPPKGEGHLTRINEILRQRMTTERRKQ